MFIYTLILNIFIIIFRLAFDLLYSFLKVHINHFFFCKVFVFVQESLMRI